MSTAPGLVDPNTAEPLEQVEKQDLAESGGTGAESADAQKSIETPKQEEEKAKPRLPAGVLQELADLRADRRLLRELLADRGKGTEEKKPPATPQARPKPVPGDFETTEAYLDARDEWVREDTLRVAREEFHKTLQEEGQKRERQSEQEILADEWGEKESAVEKEHPDYADVTAAAFEAIDSSKGPAKAALAHAIQYSEAGPEILYYLGQHPEEVQRLAGLHPTQAVIALGRIEARLAGDNPGGEKTNPPQTRAPKPPTPIKKASAADDGELRDDLSPEVWRSRFLKKLEKK